MAQEEKKIRDYMPRGYGNIIAQRTGCHPTYARKVVLEESTDAYIWPAVLQLAEEQQQKKKQTQKKMQKLKTFAA